MISMLHRSASNCPLAFRPSANCRPASKEVILNRNPQASHQIMGTTHASMASKGLQGLVLWELQATVISMDNTLQCMTSVASPLGHSASTCVLLNLCHHSSFSQGSLRRGSISQTVAGQLSTLILIAPSQWPLSHGHKCSHHHRATTSKHQQWLSAKRHTRTARCQEQLPKAALCQKG